MTRIDQTKQNIKFLKTCIWEFVIFEIILALTCGLVLGLTVQYSENFAACLFMYSCAMVGLASIKMSHDERQRMEKEVIQLSKMLDRLVLLDKIEELKK